MEPLLGDLSPKYQVYPIRWVILAIFTLLSGLNAIVWISFAPITTAAKEYFDRDAGYINLFAVVYSVVFFPGTLFAAYLSKRFGFRYTVYTGALLQALAGVIRASVVFHRESYIYERMLGGQILAGFAQPCITTISSRVAAVWFPTSERSIALLVAAMSNSLGIALGQILPPLLVTVSKDEVPVVQGMDEMLLGQGGLLVLVAICVCVWWVEGPPTPPSASEALRVTLNAGQSLNQENSEASSDLLTSPARENAIKSLFLDYWTLLKNKNFLILIVTGSLELSIFNVIATLISQIVGPCGYEDDAGTLGSLLILVGLVGSAVIVSLMAKTHAYKGFLRVCVTLAFLALLATFYLIQKDSRSIVFGAFIVFGGLMVPLLPVLLETAAECTYPMSEQTGTGLLLVIGQVPSITLLVLLGNALDSPEYKTCSSKFGVLGTQFGWVLSGVALVAVIMAYFYNGPYLRLEQERMKRSLPSSDENDNDESVDFLPDRPRLFESSSTMVGEEY